MKRLIMILCVFSAFINLYGAGKPFEIVSFGELKDGDGFNITAQMMGDEWPLSTTGREKSAWIRVVPENFPVSELGNIKFESSTFIAKQENKGLQGIWLFVDPGKNVSLDAQYKGYAQRITEPLRAGEIYVLTIRNNQSVSITVNTMPAAGAVVTLDDGTKGVTPDQIPNVTLGRHEISISCNGKTIKDTIDVSETNTRFPSGDRAYYDFRSKKNVTFESDPSDADIVIYDSQDKETLVGRNKKTIELPYGRYSAVAFSGALSDTLQFEVSADSRDNYMLRPIKKQRFEAVAYYGGKKVNGSLWIDGKPQGDYGQSSYALNLPLGKYKMEMSYAGFSKRRTVKVHPGMDPVQKFNIKAKSTFVWPWQKEFEPVVGGFSMGYVQKQYVTKGQGEILKENIWGDVGKSMHGMQIGFHYEPAFHWGLGLYTGLFYELYMSWHDPEDGGDEISFVEHNLYMPVHAYYRLPLARKVLIAVHGGIGLDYAISGKFWTGSEEDGDYIEATDFYGEEGYPKRFNLSAEIAVDLRFGPVAVTGTYSKGILDHKSYTSYGDYKTTQNKLALTVSYVFASGE